MLFSLSLATGLWEMQQQTGSGLVGIAGLPWVIAEASLVRLQEQCMVRHDVKEMRSWTLRPTATWTVDRAAH